MASQTKIHKQIKTFCLVILFIHISSNISYGKTNENNKNINQRLLLQQRLNSTSVIEDDERPKKIEKTVTCDVQDEEGHCIGEKLGLPSGSIGDVEGENLNQGKNMTGMGGFLSQIPKNKLLAKEAIVNQQINNENMQNIETSASIPMNNKLLQKNNTITNAVLSNKNNPMNRFMQQLYQPTSQSIQMQSTITQNSTRSNNPNVQQIPAPQVMPQSAKPIRIIPR